MLVWASTKENGRYIARVPPFEVMVGGKPKRKTGIRLEPTDVFALLLDIQIKADDDRSLRNLWLLLVLLFKTCFSPLGC